MNPRPRHPEEDLGQPVVDPGAAVRAALEDVTGLRMPGRGTAAAFPGTGSLETEVVSGTDAAAGDETTYQEFTAPWVAAGANDAPAEYGTTGLLSDQAGLNGYHSRPRKTNDGEGPLDVFRRRALAVVVAAVAVGALITTVAMSGGGEDPTVAAAAAPAFGYEKVPGLHPDSKRQALIKQRLADAHEFLTLYAPYIAAAAKDPRTDPRNVDPTAALMPDGLNERMLEIALLFEGNPANVDGPIPIEPSTFEAKAAQMNAIGKKLGLNLKPLNVTDQRDIQTNLSVALFQINLDYANFIKNPKNAHKSVPDFLKVYFNKAAAEAMGLYSAWTNPANPQMIYFANDDTYVAKVLVPALDQLKQDA